MADVKICDQSDIIIEGMYFHIERQSALGYSTTRLIEAQEYDIHYGCIRSWGGEQQRRYEQHEAYKNSPQDYKRGGPV